MSDHRATYRLQLNSGFPLRRLRELIPYLQRLGISHVYLAPILRARTGSSHGYDVVDPSSLNSELGTEAEFRETVAALRDADMGIVLDIVPNHMATGSENPYWMDVLRHGRCSRYAHWFDIDWGPERARRPYRIFLPVLGDRLVRVIERGELQLTYRAGEFRFAYYESSYPVDPATVPAVLEAGGAESATGATGLETAPSELRQVAERLSALPPRSGPAGRHADHRAEAAAAALAELQELSTASPAIAEYLQSAIDAFEPQAPGGAKRLRRLLTAQAYRLAYWKRAAREINYRRFFTISHLVALRQEDPDVFQATHERVLSWVADRLIDGLRIDHVDGLLDPGAYLERLRSSVADRLQVSGDPTFPIFVEKILARDERLPADWPVAGTTGYDFLNEIEDLFIAPPGERAVEASYRGFTGREDDFSAVAQRGKRSVLDGPLAAEVRRLTRYLRAGLGLESKDAPDRQALAEAIIETIVCLTVYRTYMSPDRAEHRREDHARLVGALEAARARGRAPAAALDALARGLLLEGPAILSDDERVRRLEFAQRMQQLCGAVAAKGVEDTAFYIHVPLASRNEVGGEPDVELGAASDALHGANRRRATDWPAAMLSVSTHDTKRSADVRARIDVLSEAPDDWHDCVRRWHRWNRGHRSGGGRRAAPDRNTEYHYYQTLVGAWPLEDPSSGAAEPEAVLTDEFRQRLESYMEKAVREGKRRSSWIEPDVEFEGGLRRFVRQTLSPETGGRFIADVAAFVRRIARPGLWNSLARTAVQLTAPGTPDCYQGDELWNFNLVDPDNRRPVDFERRRRWLAELTEAWSASTDRGRRELARGLAENPEDGRIKMFTIWQALEARRAGPDLFAAGGYDPVYAKGPAADHVFAFVRRHRGRAALTVVPRLVASLAGDSAAPPTGAAVWSDTLLPLPRPLQEARWTNAHTGARVDSTGDKTGELALKEVLSELPIALLLAEVPASA